MPSTPGRSFRATIRPWRRWSDRISRRTTGAPSVRRTSARRRAAPPRGRARPGQGKIEEMTSRAPLGILRIEALHYYVRDLERTRRFFVDQLDFAELGVSGPELERQGRQRSAAFRAGDA